MAIAFLLAKKGQISCEITVALADERFAAKVKNVIQGVLKLRSVHKVYVYVFFRKPDFINLVHRVNGHIRLASRHQQ
jgi:hypothetical protein